MFYILLCFYLWIYGTLNKISYHIISWGREEVYTGFWWGNLWKRDHLGDLDGRTTLRWLFRKWGVGTWTGSSWLRIGTGGGPCDCGNEPSGSIKCREFLD
jgi:hypothetical protein